jgi:hypothetical protein
LGFVESKLRLSGEEGEGEIFCLHPLKIEFVRKCLQPLLLNLLHTEREGKREKERERERGEKEHSRQGEKEEMRERRSRKRRKKIEK